MVYIRSRKFCCCIPVRAGVFILSLVGVVLGSIISVVGWRKVSQLKNYPLPDADVAALYIHSSIFTLLALLSLFGFVGTLIKQRGLVSAYGAGLIIHLCISIASGIFALVSLFKQSPQEAINECLNGSSDAATRAACKSGIAVVKGLAVVIYVVMWLLQIYAYIIVSNYVDQLDEEESLRETRNMVQAISQPAPVTTYASFAVPSQGSATYGFTHATQSHGARGNDSNIV